MTEQISQEELGKKVIAEIRKFDRIAFGTARTKHNGALNALAEADYLPEEILYRLARLVERMREFKENIPKGETDADRTHGTHHPKKGRGASKAQHS